ncbi:hypothetical protein CRN35_18620 [Vibrio vulnificus]|nr:hypothetical protein CRN35_18620 [Vibrio vulnificus]
MLKPFNNPIKKFAVTNANKHIPIHSGVFLMTIISSEHVKSCFVLTPPCAKSLFNALLCLSFKGLRFTKTKINSALIRKQKPRTKKLKRLIDLKNRL